MERLKRKQFMEMQRETEDKQQLRDSNGDAEDQAGKGHEEAKEDDGRGDRAKKDRANATKQSTSLDQIEKVKELFQKMPKKKEEIFAH